MTQSTDRFAPVSGQPSGRLRLVSGYLLGSGILATALVALAILGMIFGRPPAAVSTRIVNLAIRTIIAAGWITAGLLLQRRSKTGAVIALIMFFIPISASLLFRQPMPRLTLIVAGIGAVLVLSVFNELTDWRVRED